MAPVAPTYRATYEGVITAGSGKRCKVIIAEYDYPDGIIWHMGLPSLCKHPNIKWEDDFYVGTDHGKCQDCNTILSRVIGEYLRE